MVRTWFFRTAGATGLLLLALLVFSFDPVFSVAPPAGAAINNPTPAVVVDRSLKGDRMPIVNRDFFTSTFAPFKSSLRSQSSAASGAQAPVGCDPAFSPIFNSRFGNVYGRCTT